MRGRVRPGPYRFRYPRLPGSSSATSVIICANQFRADHRRIQLKHNCHDSHAESVVDLEGRTDSPIGNYPRDPIITVSLDIYAEPFKRLGTTGLPFAHLQDLKS